MIKRSPYEILGLEGDFEFKDIKKAYRKAIRVHSPDTNPEQFTLISDAYDYLSNEEYFMQGIEENMFVLDVSIEKEPHEKENNSRHLKNIFEVPFQI
ncbi:MAG: DnaJ domain-containing protein [Sulfurovum sp.]|nr:DnaJ domain-containing protein [Sulfurovum sp.]